MSMADEIEKLNQLRQQGILTEEEFTDQKRKLLSGTAPGGPIGAGSQSSPRGAYDAPGTASNSRFSASAPGPMPPTYLVQSVLATVLCCLPLGIMAIIKAGKVSSAYNAGDYAGADLASQEAKSFVNYAVIAGIIVGVLYGVVGAMGGKM